MYKIILTLFISISIVGCTQQIGGTQIRLAAEACGGVGYLDTVITNKVKGLDGTLYVYCTNGQKIEMRQWEVLK